MFEKVVVRKNKNNSFRLDLRNVKSFWELADDLCNDIDYDFYVMSEIWCFGNDCAGVSFFNSNTGKMYDVLSCDFGKSVTIKSRRPVLEDMIYGFDNGEWFNTDPELEKYFRENERVEDADYIKSMREGE